MIEDMLREAACLQEDHAVDIYDPDTAPDPKAWLALSETERMLLVGDFHAESDGVEDEASSRQLHVAIHVVVENQLAEGYAPAVEALARLLGEGLDRHEAVHAIGAVLAEHILARVQDGSADAGALAQYEQGLRTLTVESWHKNYGDPD